jgi:hypothetical protein
MADSEKSLQSQSDCAIDASHEADLCNGHEVWQRTYPQELIVTFSHFVLKTLLVEAFISSN